LPDSNPLILNGGTLIFRENASSPSTETLGQLTLAANTSNTIYVLHPTSGPSPATVGNVLTFSGTGTQASSTPALQRMEGATLNLITNFTFLTGGSSNEIRFTNSPSFGVLPNSGVLVGATSGTGLAIVPWATITTFAGDRSRESIDLVSDIDGTIGGSTMSLGALPTYDAPNTLNGNIKI